jgi:hypothetical protein
MLPDCEANIARLALFAQQTGRAAAPLAPQPGTPMPNLVYEVHQKSSKSVEHIATLLSLWIAH